MGGVTLTKIGKTREEALEKIREDILNAPHTMYPDSDVAVLNPETGEGHCYRVEWEPTVEGRPTGVKLVEIPEKEGNRIGLPLTVSKLYGPEPKPGEWVATVHLG